MLKQARYRARLFNAALMSISCVVALMLGEGLLRLRYAEPLREPMPEVLAIQEYLRLHPVVGFTWKANVEAGEEVVFEYEDAQFEPLSTDQHGFINSPEAILARKAGGGVDVIGLGDSFVEHAAHIFHRALSEAGLAYYSMAIHRQSPPQYTAILQDYALPLEPRWVLYGIFENDFSEAVDYDRWRESGLDWFAFHSGTWCGRPVNVSPVIRFKETHLRGLTGLYEALLSRLRGDRVSTRAPSQEGRDRVLEETLRAFALAQLQNVQFLVLLIPSRGTSLGGESPESEAYDALLAAFEESRVPVLDLRNTFAADPDPGSLYYERDGHWNKHGMTKAADAILARIHPK